MTSWQDKRIYAVNRLIERKGIHLYQSYIDEVDSIYKSKAINKYEYKLERKKHEKDNLFNVIRNKLCV